VHNQNLSKNTLKNITLFSTANKIPFVAVIVLFSFSKDISATEYYWENGSRQGSKYYWLNGTGPNSQYYWENGSRQGSKYYWLNGTGPNSQYYWENGSRQGSKYYWLNATKKSFYNPISICMGLIESNSELPAFCEGYR